MREWGGRGCLGGDQIYTTYLCSKEISHKKTVYICIFLNTSSSFQLSLSLKHTSQITFVCGCSIVISVASPRCFCCVAVFFEGSRQVVGGESQHTLKSPGAVKGLGQGEDEVAMAPTPHTLPPSIFEIQPPKCRKPLPLPSCLSYVLLLLTFFPNCIQNLSGPAPLLQYLNTSPGPQLAASSSSSKKLTSTVRGGCTCCSNGPH